MYCSQSFWLMAQAEVRRQPRQVVLLRLRGCLLQDALDIRCGSDQAASQIRLEPPVVTVNSVRVSAPPPLLTGPVRTGVLGPGVNAAFADPQLGACSG